jgi:NAD(P)-dependent dehydrogenase (short-subunit alcohol dehydrogenase family)
MGLVDGKVAFVTGAGSGIGRAAAILFAAEGAHGVCCVDIDHESAEATAALVRTRGGAAIGIACDISRAPEVEAAVAACVDTFGGLDCAHNNAGIAPRPTLTGLFSESDWQRTIDVLLTGTWLCMRAEIQQMLAQGGGAIVNTSSTAGFSASPGMSPYVAAKHGVLGLTRNAALEYVRLGIRINAICPGATLTGMMQATDGGTGELIEHIANVQPGGRISDPREQAEAAVWLCSDRASFITGVALRTDNGATLGATVDLSGMRRDPED